MIKSFLFFLTCLIVLTFTAPGPSGASESGSQTISAKTAHWLLMDGNKRYMSERATHKRQDRRRRIEIKDGQHPFAVIVCCSDSRVPPEIIFDQGLGDLFVIRLAGNIVDDAALGSIEYAVEHLGTNYVMILGHENCGAVKATVEGGKVPGHIGHVVDAIKPAVDSVRGKTADLPEVGMRAHVTGTVERLKTTDPILKEKVTNGQMMIVGGRYDLDDGRVNIWNEGRWDW